jgi:hypothetical protein
MDDSRVGPPDKQTQLVHLEMLFTALAANGLAINLEKCIFAVPTLEILGHSILVAGSTPYGRTHHCNRYLTPHLRISNNGNVFSTC